MKRKILEIGAVALMAVGIVFSMVGCAGIGTPKVNLNDYVVAEVEGYDGHGSIVRLEIDCKALAEKYGDRAKNGQLMDDGYRYVFDEENYPDWEGSWAYGFGEDVKTAEEAAEKAFYFYTPELSEKTYEETGEPHEDIENETLSNGDVLELVWVPDEKTEQDIKVLEAIFNIDVVYEDFTYTIDGLEKVKEYN